MSKSHTKKGWKADRDLVAGDADYEVDVVQAKMKKEGIIISAQQIRNLIIEFGHSRRRLYAVIRERQQQPENTDTNEG